MSFQAQNWVVANSKQKGSAFLVLLMIANHAHADGSNAYPSIKTLATECRLSERQIVRIVKALEKSGELIIERSAGRVAHLYAINMSPNPDKLSGSKNAPTLTNPKFNPDKSVTPTLTNPALNPDKSGISIYKDEPSLEPSLEPSERENTPAPGSTEIADETFGTELEENFQIEEVDFEQLPVIKIFKEIFPQQLLSIHTMEEFHHRLPEIEESIWRQTLRDWRFNSWSTRSFSKMIDSYKNNLFEGEKSKNGNGNNPKTPNGSGSSKSGRLDELIADSDKRFKTPGFDD